MRISRYTRGHGRLSCQRFRCRSGQRRCFSQDRLPGNVALGRDFKLVGEMFDMPRVWAEMASNLVTHASPECGHLPHEEKPEEINRLLIDFLAGWKG
jgi:hypothetical protein